MRQTGILMPLSALPSRTGIGELGEFAYRWIEILKNSGVKIWQLLPLNPVGYGNSPYQPYSSCAGDELYISLSLIHIYCSKKGRKNYENEKNAGCHNDSCSSYRYACGLW